MLIHNWVKNIFQKYSAWSDVQSKAKTLVQNGNVSILLHTPTHTLAKVQGFHGVYDIEFKREDPDAPYALTQSYCSCPWEQFRWDRTRKWKKFEGRSCSHLLAAYWKSLSTPMDVEEGQEYAPAPGQRMQPFSEQEVFDQNKGQLPGITEQQADMGNLPQTFTPEDQAPAPTPTEVPQTKDLINPQPLQNPFAVPERKAPAVPQRQQLQLFDITAPPVSPFAIPVQPVSVPGGRPPTPGNPLQFPGTLSHMVPVIMLKTSNFITYSKDNFEEWIETALKDGKPPIVQIIRPVTLEQSGGKIPMPGAEPTGFTAEGVPQYNMMDLGYHPELGRRVNQDEVHPNGNVGSPGQTGVYSDAAAGKRAEVIDIEPLLKMIYVHVPLNDSGPLHPHLLKGWINYSDTVPLPDANTPFRTRR